MISAAGNGGSSGTVVEGILVNQTVTEKKIDIHISSPLYFVNRGAGQNMVAVQVYLGDGAYASDGRRSFIVLKPRAQTRVVFVAFCADFDKENPAIGERFSVETLPAHLARVVAKVNAYMIANPNVDAVPAAQAAIWLAQGETIADIRSKFTVTAADERLARSLAQ